MFASWPSSAWAGTSATRSWSAPTPRNSPTIRTRSNGSTARRWRCPRAAAPTGSRRRCSKRGHPAVRVSEPEHRGHHEQLPRRQARRRGDVGADDLAPGAGGLARKVATGASVNENDAGFLGMRADLDQAAARRRQGLAQRRSSMRNCSSPIRRTRWKSSRWRWSRPPAFPERSLWMAAYGTYPKEGGGTPTRIILPYAFTSRSDGADQARFRVPVRDQEHQCADAAPGSGDAGIRAGGAEGARPSRRRSARSSRCPIPPTPAPSRHAVLSCTSWQRSLDETFNARRAGGVAGGDERDLVSFGHRAGGRASSSSSSAISPTTRSRIRPW